MEFERQFVDFYVIYVYFMTTASIMVNALLAVVIYLSKTKNDRYLYYTVDFVIMNFAFSITSSLVMPYYHQYPTVCSMFSVAALRFPQCVEARLLDAWLAFVIAVIILVSSSFLYRYSIVCKSRLLPFYQSRFKNAFTVSIPLYALFWVLVSRAFLVSDEQNLRSLLALTVGKQLNIDFNTANLISINFMNYRSSFSFFVAHTALCSYLGAQAFLILFCGFWLNRTIRHATMSHVLRKKHFKALRILIFQALNPFIFLYGPFILVFISCHFNTNSTLPEKFADITIHFFPINNALIILTMTDDYRNTLMTRVGMKDKKPPIEITVSLATVARAQNLAKRKVTRNTLKKTNFPLIVYTIYFPILFGIYLFQVVIVIVNKRKPQFRSSYFTMFIIEAFTGLSTAVVTTIAIKLAIFPEINAFYADFPANAFTTGLYFSAFYFPACQEYVNIFIALNRLSALVFYDKYEQAWKLIRWLCLPVIFGFPFISYYHLLDTSAYYLTINNGTSWFIDYDHSVRPWRSNRVQSFALYLACSVTTLVINLMTVVAIRCMSMEKVSSIEFRLFLLGFFSFACGLPMTIQQALSPYILSLIFSSAIRNEFIRVLKPRRTTVVSSII